MSNNGLSVVPNVTKDVYLEDKQSLAIMRSFSAVQSAEGLARVAAAQLETAQLRAPASQAAFEATYKAHVENVAKVRTELGLADNYVLTELPGGGLAFRENPTPAPAAPKE